MRLCIKAPKEYKGRILAETSNFANAKWISVSAAVDTWLFVFSAVLAAWCLIKCGAVPQLAMRPWQVSVSATHTCRKPPTADPAVADLIGRFWQDGHLQVLPASVPHAICEPFNRTDMWDKAFINIPSVLPAYFFFNLFFLAPSSSFPLLVINFRQTETWNRSLSELLVDNDLL